MHDDLAKFPLAPVSYSALCSHQGLPLGTTSALGHCRRAQRTYIINGLLMPTLKAWQSGGKKEPSQVACFSEDLKYWETRDTTCRHKSEDITPSPSPGGERREKIFPAGTEEGHRQSDEHWNRFKGDIAELTPKRGKDSVLQENVIINTLIRFLSQSEL